ncbi:MAG: RES family NAD+ phosphorylase [Puniceicoccaceae bacterium]
MEWLDPACLESDWLGPMLHPETQRIGDAWLKSGRSLVLAVPSALIPEEPIFLLNPRHPEFDRLPISPVESFALDPRLLH